jgi:hypothetical protein
MASVVFPIRVEGDRAGVGVFNADIEQTTKLMEADPTRSFPEDSLPE